MLKHLPGAVFVYTRSGSTWKAKTLMTVRLANVPTNTAASYVFRVTFKKGNYLWTVKTPDVAGNTGKAGGAKKLTVK